MNAQNDSLNISWLKRTQGKRLVKADAEAWTLRESEVKFNFDCIEMSLENHIGAINLEFKNLGSCKFFCGIDGASICSEEESMEAFSMGEYGEQNVYSLNSQDLWATLISKSVTSIRLIKSELENSIFGIYFLFEHNLEVTIANIGDNLVCVRSLNPEILQGEKAKSILIF